MDEDKLFEIGMAKRDKKIRLSWSQINKEYGDGRFDTGDGARNWVLKQFKSGRKVAGPVSEDEKQMHSDLNDKDLKAKSERTIELNKDGTQTSIRLLHLNETELKNPECLVKMHGYNIKTWELVSARNNIWDVYSKQDGISELYSSKIIIKPRLDTISMEEVKEHFEKFSKKHKPPVIVPTQYSLDGKMLEVNIADTHIGKLCWSGDTGEDYDFKIARERFLHVINDDITRTRHYKFEKVVFIWSNDFFHFDNSTATTTKGTLMDTDMRWQKLYLKGVELLIEAVDMLATLAPVETFYVGANHDKTTSYYALNYLYAWYRNIDYVAVDTDPKSRKYYEFGKCLIGFAHGDTERKRIAGLMPLEAKAAWGRTCYREVHQGHLHSELVREDQGIIIRNLSSITSTDAWHYESGFVGAVKKSQTFIWDREYGLTDIIHSVIPTN